MKEIISAKYSQLSSYIPDPKRGYFKNLKLRKGRQLMKILIVIFISATFSEQKRIFLSKANRIHKSRSKVLAAIISAGNY